MVSLLTCHSLILTVILGRYLISMRLYVGERFVGEGLPLGIASSPISELKLERRKADRRWRSSRLAARKQLYDAVKQKVTDLVLDAKTSFYSAMVSSSAACKELFHNMTTLLGKTSKPSLPSVYDLKQLPGIFNDFFKHKIISIRSSFSLTALKIDDCQSAFSGAPFLSFTPASEEIVETIMLQTVPKTSVLDPNQTKLLYKKTRSSSPNDHEHSQLITGFRHRSL